MRSDQRESQWAPAHTAGPSCRPMQGSTCAMVESILRTCGYKTGLFTSPHLWTVRERIQINGCLPGCHSPATHPARTLFSACLTAAEPQDWRFRHVCHPVLAVHRQPPAGERTPWL